MGIVRRSLAAASLGVCGLMVVWEVADRLDLGQRVTEVPEQGKAMSLATPDGPPQDVVYGDFYRAYTRSAGSMNACRLIFGVFGIAFYYMVAKDYPLISSPTPQAKQIMETNAVEATCNACCTSNFWLAWCCYPARVALNYQATGLMNYWGGLFGTIFCPCCMVWYGSSCSDHMEKLGGEKMNCCSGCLCACCCNCCVILRDAEAVDACTGVKTGIIGVSPATMAREPLLDVGVAPAAEDMA